MSSTTRMNELMEMADDALSDAIDGGDVSVEEIQELLRIGRARAEEERQELERNRRRIEELEDENKADYEDC